jgi:hypothetical protein
VVYYIPFRRFVKAYNAGLLGKQTDKKAARVLSVHRRDLKNKKGLIPSEGGKEVHPKPAILAPYGSSDYNRL